MKLERIEKLLDALIVNATGWTGDLQGPMHMATVQASKDIQERKAEIMRERGICPKCGCNQ